MREKMCIDFKNVDKADIKEVCDMVLEKIRYPEGQAILDKTLQAFTKNASGQPKKYTLIESVLNNLLKSNVSTHHVDSIVNRIALEFAYFEKKYLLKLVEFCLTRIQKNDDDFMSWKDMLPQLLQTLREEKYISHRGTELTGVEYKSTIAKTICLNKYEIKLSASLAKMFRDMSLDKADLVIIVKALCNTIAETEVSEIPPLVYQLIRLSDDSKLLLITLQRYFSQKYAESSQENSEDCDMIGSTCMKDIQDSESTVLYHIYQAVQLDHKILKDYLAFLKSVTDKPEFVLDPFIISVLLYNVNIFKDQVFDVLKLSILRKFNDDERSKNSMWCKKLVPDNWRVIDELDAVIRNSLGDRRCILENLLVFGFYLMGTEKRVGHNETILWEVGTKIVQKIARKEPKSVPTILQYLSEKIMSSENSFLQYTDCLSYMCRKLTLPIQNNLTSIISLLEEVLLSKSESDVMPVVSAIFPLLKTSQRVRDTLVLVLRKALTKSSINLRKMSVLGFLELLKNLKVSSLNALSQGNNCSSSTSVSSSSIITQATLGKHVANPPQDPKYNMSLCQELLSILRRCFMYDSQVRLYLYKGVYDAVDVNIELTEYVSEMLLEHLMLFYDPDETILPPIIFDKCTITQGAEEILQEPLGELIFLIQKLYIKTALKHYAALSKFAVILESLCKRMTQTEAEHLNLNETTDLSDNLPKSQKTLHNLKLSISVCEALIAYRFGSWSMDSVNFSQSVKDLFKTYTRFVEFLKKTNKVKKGDQKKVDKDATLKRKNTRAATLKLPNTVMDVYTVHRMLLLLYENELSWVSKEERQILQNRADFNNYVLQTCLQLIRNAKLLKGNLIKKHKDQYSKTYIQIGRLLLKNVISKEDEEETNPVSFLYAVECFKELCDLMCNHWTSELIIFLNVIGNANEKEDMNIKIESVLTTLKKQFSKCLRVNDDDGEFHSKKVSLYLMETISYLIHKMKFDNLTSTKIKDLLDFEDPNETIETSVCLIIIQLMLFVDIRTTELGEYLRTICDDLNDKSSKNNQPDDTGDSQLINKNTFVQVYCAVNTSLKSKLRDVASIFSRLKAEQNIVVASEIENDKNRSSVRSTERHLCAQLSNITGMINVLIKCKCGIGLHTDGVFKNLQQLFNILSNLTKYFSNKPNSPNISFEATKFTHLVENAGTTLKPNVDELIMYIEEYNNKEGKNTDLNALRNKIIKETKIIPRVIYEMEQFNKDVLSLSKKSGVELIKRIKHSLTRDFRIDAVQLEANLERLDASMLTTQNTTHHASRVIEDEVTDCDKSGETESETE